MSRETMTDLNQNTLIGYTDKRGNAWHYRASDQGEESNHYTGAIPVEDVRRRLFNWDAIEGELTATALTDSGVVTYTDPDRKAIMRSDTGKILGIFKNGYKIHGFDQWLIQNVENLLDANLAIGSAGLLKGGAVAWVQVEMEDTLEVEGVEFRPFLTAATSLDGSLATSYTYGAQVVVCDNTLHVAVTDQAAKRFKIKHSTNSLNRIGDVREALGIVYSVGDAFAQEVELLTQQTVSEAQWKEFLTAHAGPDTDSQRSKTMAETKMGELNRLWRHDERVAPWAGTAYGVLSAVNTYTHHHAIVRGASRVERNMERAVTGKVAAVDHTALRDLHKVGALDGSVLDALHVRA
jgi:phage/plasmid-like protein (TIGR03299 family)